MNEGDITTCPVCDGEVVIARRADGSADHYERIPLVDKVLPEQDKVVADELRELRKGKKTVAIVGMSESSCSLAPFKEDVELWGMNEMHAFTWMTRADRWFQIHSCGSVQREVQKRDITGHYDWLKANEWYIPIYTQYMDKDIPNCVVYPLEDVSKFFKNFRRGKDEIKYFTSTFAYYMGVALLEGFERIEIYGFEMSGAIEYVKQKACAEFWIGLAMGMDIEIYTPDNCELLSSDLYGGNEQGEGW